MPIYMNKGGSSGGGGGSLSIRQLSGKSSTASATGGLEAHIDNQGYRYLDCIVGASSSAATHDVVLTNANSSISIPLSDGQNTALDLSSLLGESEIVFRISVKTKSSSGSSFAYISNILLY